MNRRGHLSTKVPNVKLRPAPPKAQVAASTGTRRGRRSPSPLNAMDQELLKRAMAGAEDEEASTSALRKTQRPWAGTVITFTGVEDKARLNQMAVELGARVELALTTSVTHVVAEGHTTAKYHYAVEHKIPVVTPGWIEEAHKMWIESEEWVEEELLKAFKLKPFEGLRICMSGIEPLDRRRKVIELINANGGTYAKDLDRSCTHLISSKPTTERVQSEKLKWAVKELNAREATRRAGKTPEGDDMRIVYEEWIWDCVGFEGRWKEDGYDARKVRKTGKVNPDDVLCNRIPDILPKRKDREEEDTDEPAVLKKRKRDTNLVNELLSTSAIVKTEPEQVDTTSRRQITPESADADRSWMAAVKPDPSTATAAAATAASSKSAPSNKLVTEEPRRTSLLHMSRTSSFAETSTTATTTSMTKTAASKAEAAAAATYPAPVNAPTSAADAAASTSADLSTVRFLEGLSFSHVIESETKGLEEALKRFGGIVVPEEERLEGAHVDYVIVRLCSNLKPQTPRQSSSTGVPAVIVTECWIEACCYQQKLLSPDDKLVFRPLTAPMPVFGACRLSIHLSGFSSEQTTFLRRLIRVIGGQLSVKMTRKCTHLVCKNPSGQKYEKALEWGLQVVKDTWIETAAMTGVMPQEDDHRHNVIEDFGIAALRPLGGRTAGGAGPDSAAAAVISSPPRPLKSTPTFLHGLDDPSIDMSVAPPEISHSTRIVDSVIMDTTSLTRTKATAARVPSRRSSGNPLSPPHLQMERRLNGADLADSDNTDDKRHKGSQASFSLGRTASAPPPESPGKSRSNRAQLTKSASTTILNGMESLPGASKADVTEVLRQLAEGKGDSPASGTKVVRRQRPLSRLRTGTAMLSPLANVSPSTSTTTPTADGLPSSPERTFELDEGVLDHPGGIMAEESMRVVHLDPAAMKERRRMEEALNGFRSRR